MFWRYNRSSAAKHLIRQRKCGVLTFVEKYLAPNGYLLTFIENYLAPDGYLSTFVKKCLAPGFVWVKHTQQRSVVVSGRSVSEEQAQ